MKEARDARRKLRANVRDGTVPSVHVDGVYVLCCEKCCDGTRNAIVCGHAVTIMLRLSFFSCHRLHCVKESRAKTQGRSTHAD